ncbi:helix-turn-helix domain-containing protein [Amycolatopsis nigrescens]|uniref:helix-turn-helix domain-containing protein n=1 Tax=Amycolatopsis nigrescens TaxID=381445 RepID=UPI001FDEB13F|nr:helix-turn-helix transcriptional regulator [Amycolatopsis nigrescens]
MRRALRLSVRAFAEHLGVAPRTVAKWEAGGADTVPRLETQAILDAALNRADGEARDRFELLLGETGEHWIPAQRAPQADPGRSQVDYESWSDDLDRTLVCLGRQEFRLAHNLLQRWLYGYEPNSNDTRGLQLYGRSLWLLGEVQQDQGSIQGPLSAQQSYRKAVRIYTELDMPRRVAQLELQLVVVEEMCGRLDVAAQRYELLATDHRLSERDRTRARLWIGTALSKRGLNESATQHIVPAIHGFENLEEPLDWSIAHQKLALAHRGAGDLRTASQFIDIALSNRAGDTPMQRVRLDTAYAHILLSDKATSSSGLEILDQAGRLSAQYGLLHQLQSIENIRRTFEGQSA